MGRGRHIRHPHVARGRPARKTKANERAEHLQQFLDAIPIGVKVREATGAPAYSNPSASWLLGHNPAEVPGQD
jgi:hypothetical protein